MFLIQRQDYSCCLFQNFSSGAFLNQLFNWTPFVSFYPIKTLVPRATSSSCTSSLRGTSGSELRVLKALITSFPVSPISDCTTYNIITGLGCNSNMLCGQHIHENVQLRASSHESFCPWMTFLSRDEVILGQFHTCPEHRDEMLSRDET